MLTRADGDDFEISDSRIPDADVVFRDCQCCCEWTGDDELDCVMGFAEYRG